MIIKEAEREQCSKCGHKGKVISKRVYGCDNCKNEFDDKSMLRLTVFNQSVMDAIHHHFCCWGCVLEFLPKVKSDNFIDLPYLSYEKETEGCGAKDFIKLTRQ